MLGTMREGLGRRKKKKMNGGCRGRRRETEGEGGRGREKDTVITEGSWVSVCAGVGNTSLSSQARVVDEDVVGHMRNYMRVLMTIT